MSNESYFLDLLAVARNGHGSLQRKTTGKCVRQHKRGILGSVGHCEEFAPVLVRRAKMEEKRHHRQDGSLRRCPTIRCCGEGMPCHSHQMGHNQQGPMTLLSYVLSGLLKSSVVVAVTNTSTSHRTLDLVNTTLHTSYFVTDSHAHAWLKLRVCRAHTTCHPHVFCFDFLPLLHFPPSADHLLSYHLVLPPAHQLHLPRCGGQIPCAHSLMRTLAIWPSTTLSQVMSPTTTTSRRLLNPTSRNPRLITQEREDDACRRRAYHSQEEGLSSSLSSSVSHD